MATQDIAPTSTAGTGCVHAWVSVEDLAEELQIPKSTIYGWKTRGIGPQWTRVGRHLRARRTQVDLWLDSLAESA